MPIFKTTPNSATTLSIRPTPGENKRLVDTNSEAIFTFGDFTVETNYSINYLSANTKDVQFGVFDNLETLNAVNFSTNISIPFVQRNELNLPKKNPKSHSYFSSFYTNVATSINNIISNFPYAILSYNNGNVNVFDYTEYYNGKTFEKTCSFKIPISGLTNQGNVSIVSANTENNFSLPYDYDKFVIQLSGQTDVFRIKDYSYSGTYLYFEIYGLLKHDNPTSTHTDSLYIRPSVERLFNYNNTISSLETQLLNEGKFLIPAIDTVADDSFEQTFIWPRTIDGFAPDSYGASFETYKNSILKQAEKVDEEKTDIFIRTVIPENFLEHDSDGQIYRTIIQTYAHEFDNLKNYIDAMAYAHSVDYDNEETVPKKFLGKLSTLLGWKLSEGFNELDLFEYLTSDVDENSNSYSHFNVEIWKRILVNLVWLYKKKGTRDAIMFIFKLLGAPDCLINFNEFVYDITKNSTYDSAKVDDDGYINYASSQYIFQEGGFGRGNGDAYINQWRPEFNPTLRIDTNKIEIGDPTGGTRSIVNTKEMQIGFSPAQAIECDVFSYYKNGGNCWVWGSLSPPFSCLTIPFEYLHFSCDDLTPPNMADMTLAQYLDYVYTNSIDPTTRKTNAQCHTTWGYPELQNAYLAYYGSNCGDHNNNLNMCKLEAYLQLLEVQLGSYIAQLIPSTTIFEDGVATVYKNTVFSRQKFVYKEGVDKGSMFKRKIDERIHPSIKFPKLNLTQNENTKVKNTIVKINCKKNDNLTANISNCNLKINYITTKSIKLNTYKIKFNINKNYAASITSVTLIPGDINGTTQKTII